MKKTICMVLALIMALLIFPVCAKETVLTSSDVEFTLDTVVKSDSITNLKKGGYFGFSKVDMSGINSIEATVKANLPDLSTGETLAVILDDPYNGTHIGNIVLTKRGEYQAKCNITPVSGVHDLYFYCLYASEVSSYIFISQIKLSSENYVNNSASEKVEDSYVKDLYQDTWTATDSMGRKVADYEETGGVRDGKREVGMAFWNWHGVDPNRRAVVIPEFLSKYPEAKDDYNDPNWDSRGRFYWGRPIFGFYNSTDYWVYIKQADLLGSAGVDVIFLDYSNQGRSYLPILSMMVEAFRDAKKAGINVPKISCFNFRNYAMNTSVAESLYFHCFVENDYSDIWYYRDGKPFILGNTPKSDSLASNLIADAESSKSTYAKELAVEVGNFFSNRATGHRNITTTGWQWAESFPQALRNCDENGKPEFVTVSAARNGAPYTPIGEHNVFSNPDTRSRGSSEMFGEDYSEDGMRKAYFFREQSGLALAADPEFLFAGQWNEWVALRNENYQGYENAFVDTFDYARSRDFEPNDGPLKDDYYNLLVDLIRKFKGARKAPVLSGMKSIDVKGDVSEWEGVGPEFLNSSQSLERDSYGYLDENGNETHYTTKINNAITVSKVTFDDEKLYFMAECENDIKRGGEGFMNLYINIDRNYATGWEGFDFAVNLMGEGVISECKDNAWSWDNIGNAEVSVSGKVIQIALPRSVIGETGTVDFEFKWTDSVDCDGDFMKFYSEGMAAPIARFNYLATQIEQTALQSEYREALSGVSVLKAGNPKMVVSGGKMNVYEPDTRIAPFEMNGTLYIPHDTLNEIMGYGRTKTEYSSVRNIFYSYHYDYSDDFKEAINYTWTYCTPGSYEVRVNGKLKTLSASVIIKDGTIYVPLSFIEDCYGIKTEALGDGAYSIGLADKAALDAAVLYLG